jgi:hypothetical protein
MVDLTGESLSTDDSDQITKYTTEFNFPTLSLIKDRDIPYYQYGSFSIVCKLTIDDKTQSVIEKLIKLTTKQLPFDITVYQFKDGTCDHDTARKWVFQSCELTSVEYDKLTYSKSDSVCATLNLACASVLQDEC